MSRSHGTVEGGHGDEVYVEHYNGFWFVPNSEAVPVLHLCNTPELLVLAAIRV